MMTLLPELATEMSAALAAGQVTSEELIESSLKRARSDSARAALTTLTTERARTEAALSDERRQTGQPRGPLDGIPITWKDLFSVKGTVTTAGSQSRIDSAPAENDSALVQRAQSHGLVTVGKTNLSEFAFSGLGINSHFGTPVNPNNGHFPLVPGGSSSGAAASVAAGIAPLSVGTDTSGSIRIPAAFCGLVGYRASKGRYGPEDFEPLSSTLDSVGVIARSIDDIIALDKLIGPAQTIRSERRVSRMSIPDGEWMTSCTPEVRRLFSKGMEALQKGGVTIELKTFASMQAAQRLMDAHGTIVGAEAAFRHATAVDSKTIESATARRLSRNIGSSHSIGEVYKQMMPLRTWFEEELAGAVLLCPTVRHTPPTMAALIADQELYDATNATTLRTTMLLSYLGLCGVSLPIRAEDGTASVGMLASLPDMQDDDLLQTAMFMEKALRTA